MGKTMVVAASSFYLETPVENVNKNNKTDKANQKNKIISQVVCAAFAAVSAYVLFSKISTFIQNRNEKPLDLTHLSDDVEYPDFGGLEDTAMAFGRQFHAVTSAEEFSALIQHPIA